MYCFANFRKQISIHKNLIAEHLLPLESTNVISFIHIIFLMKL